MVMSLLVSYALLIEKSVVAWAHSAKHNIIVRTTPYNSFVKKQNSLSGAKETKTTVLTDTKKIVAIPCSVLTVSDHSRKRMCY